MWKGIRELVDLLLLWGFWYFGSFMLMIVAIFYFIQSNQPPIIKQYHTHNTVQVVEPPKRVLDEQKTEIEEDFVEQIDKEIETNIRKGVRK